MKKVGLIKHNWLRFFLGQYFYFYAPGFSRGNENTNFAQTTFEKVLTYLSTQVMNAAPLTTSTQEVLTLAFISNFTAKNIQRIIALLFYIIS